MTILFSFPHGLVSVTQFSGSFSLNLELQLQYWTYIEWEKEKERSAGRKRERGVDPSIRLILFIGLNLIPEGCEAELVLAGFESMAYRDGLNTTD